MTILFEEMGLEPQRLELRGHSPSLEEHLAAYHDVDIALDTFPYTGCTTTADALWMGVPVLTVAGKSMVSRQAAAVLQGVGCEQWICKNEAEMVEQALSLANDCKELQELRMHQRQKMVKSDLIDHAGLAVSLENAFRSWWLRWLQKQDWPIETKQTWHQINRAKDRALLTPVTNSVCRRLPLWLGELTEAEKLDREGRGHVWFA